MTSKKKLKRKIRKLECQLSCLLDMSVEREQDYLAFRREHEEPEPEPEPVVNDATAMITVEALEEENDEDELELERIVRESRARMASLKRTSDAAKEGRDPWTEPKEGDIGEMLHEAEQVLECMASHGNYDHLNQSLRTIRAARARMDKADKSRENHWTIKY